MGFDSRKYRLHDIPARITYVIKNRCWVLTLSRLSTHLNTLNTHRQERLPRLLLISGADIAGGSQSTFFGLPPPVRGCCRETGQAIRVVLLTPASMRSVAYAHGVVSNFVYST